MKIGSNKVKIIIVSLLRFIVVSISLVALYGSSVDNPNTNNVAFVVIAILHFAFAASPLRHWNDVLELCPNKIIFKRRAISFSTIDEIVWRYDLYPSGRRIICCKDAKNTGLKAFFFPYYEIDVTYIKEPQESFVKYYTNPI